MDEFKYLGILFTGDGRMTKAMERMHLPFSLAMARVRALIKQEGIAACTFTYVWLFQVLALSASMYGCQVWSTPYLQKGKADLTLLSRSHALFFKRVLGLPFSTSTKCVLRECGQLPLQFYWVRCVLRFWNLCLANPNPLVQQGFRADWHLAVHDHHQTSWVGDLLQYLEEPGEQNAWKRPFAESVRSFSAVSLAQFAKLWVVDDLADWRPYEEHEPAGIDPDRFSRVMCAYHTYFAVPPFADWMSWRAPSDKRSTDKPPVPRYFIVSLRPDLRKALARFRLSAHNLRVVTGRYDRVDYFDRHCRLTQSADCQFPQDEPHAVFHCPHPVLVDLRQQFGHLFDVSAPAEGTHQQLSLFMNQQEVVDVAKFVKRLQALIECLRGTPMTNHTNTT